MSDRRSLLLLALTTVVAVAALDLDPGGLGLLAVRPLEDRRGAPEDVAVVAYPMGLVEVEPTHCLISGMPTLMMLAIANPRGLDIRGNCRVGLSLPEGVEPVAVNAFLDWDGRISKQSDAEGVSCTWHSFRLRPANDTVPSGKARNGWYASHRPPAVWLATTAAPGTVLGSAQVWVEVAEAGSDELRRSPASAVALRVLEPLSASTPVLARSGLMGRCGVSYSPSHPEAARVIAGAIAAMGCNLYYDGPPQAEAPPGLKRWTEGHNLWQKTQGAGRQNLPALGVGNGFFLHLPRDVVSGMPESIRFVDGALKRRARELAPWAAYGRHPWVVENVLEPIAAAIARGEFETLWANWEPGSHVRDSGFSEGAKDAFILHSGMARQEVEKLWPQDLVKEHADQWRAFRSWELGQWTRVLAETVHEASVAAGGKGRFVVATSASYMYADDLLMNCAAWGDFPYVFQTWSYHFTPQVHERYPPSDRRGAPQVVRSALLARRLDALFGTERAAWGSCLYGWDQSGYHTGFLEPEHLGFRHLSTVLGGLEVVHNYGEWPIFDGRWAHELARANTRIARWETYALQGRKQRRHVVIPVSPYPQTVPLHVRPEAQEPQSWDGYLYSFEYELDGRRLFAVANAWDFGEVFVRLRVFGADAATGYTLSEPEEDRVFANEDGSTALSAADLADGLLVHVGALRWGCFLLEPRVPGQAMNGSQPMLPAAAGKALGQRADGLLATLEEQEEIWAPVRESKAARAAVARIAPDCSRRVASVPAIDPPPTVDGILDDSCWAAGAVNGEFQTARDRAPVLYATAWRAVRCGAVLYLAVECRQDMAGAVAAATTRDGRVWRDDSVEVFLNPLAPEASRDTLQLIVNPAGTVFDAWRGNSRDWNGVERVAVATSAESWSMEAAIPLAEVGIDVAEAPAARINVIRNVVGTRHNREEISSWYPSWAAHADPGARGVLVFR